MVEIVIAKQGPIRCKRVRSLNNSRDWRESAQMAQTFPYHIPLQMLAWRDYSWNLAPWEICSCLARCQAPISSAPIVNDVPGTLDEKYRTCLLLAFSTNMVVRGQIPCSALHCSCHLESAQRLSENQWTGDCAASMNDRPNLSLDCSVFTSVQTTRTNPKTGGPNSPSRAMGALQGTPRAVEGSVLHWSSHDLRCVLCQAHNGGWYI